MKVLQIGATFVGAQERVEYAIHKQLLNQNYGSYILYAIGQSNDKNVICYENRFANIVRRVLRKYICKNPHFAIFSTLKLIHYAERIDPDIVNLHIIHHGYIDYILLFMYLRKKRIPVVFTVHDMWVFTGGCYYYTNIKCDGYKKGCVKCLKKQEELDCSVSKTNLYFKKKNKLLANLVKLDIVSVSPWVYSEVMESSLKNYTQHIVCNGIGEVLFDFSSIEKNKKFSIIGVATNWDDRKGIEQFFELGNILENQCDIILVGFVDTKLQIKAPNNIRFIGPVNDVQELYRLYAMSDLHISMSLEETFGLTFIEAAFCGIKSMGFNSTAIPYVLEKTYGYIINSNKVVDMTDKIKHLCNHREECRLSENELEKVKKYFSSEEMAKKYVKIFEGIFKGK